MKNRWLVIGIILLVLIVLGIIIFLFSLNSAQPVTDNSPATNPFVDTTAPTQGASASSQTLPAFIGNCFTEYVSNYIAKGNAPSYSPRLNEFAQSCFTSEYIAQWPAIANESDSDPVLFSQDFYPSWQTNANVSIISQTSTTTTALVNLGSGNETIQLIASLQMTTNGWRISGVTLPQTSPNQ